MADALCGPSNALQKFQKHSQVDRTLQQDRLVSRQSPSQGFRPSPGPNAGLLDSEFEAFQAGHIASPSPQFDTRPFAAHNTSHFAPQPQAALPDWANDFQRLHIAPAHPTSHQSSAPAVQRAPVTTHSPQTSWHQDFMQSQQPMASFHQPQPMFQPFQDMSWEYNQQPAQFSPVSHGKQKMMQEQDSQWNAEAFAAAFEAASLDAVEAEPEYDDGLSEEMLAREIAREIEMETEEVQFLIQARQEEEAAATQQMRQETNHLSALDLSQGFLDVDEEFASASAEHYMEDPHPFLRDDIGILEPVHDLPRDEQQETTSSTPKSIDEELARTAGHLLESVSHETSEKFQSSVFLQLMRRLRDREVTVEGENFVEVSEDPLQSIPTPPSASTEEGVN